MWKNALKTFEAPHWWTLIGAFRKTSWFQFEQSGCGCGNRYSCLGKTLFFQVWKNCLAQISGVACQSSTAPVSQRSWVLIPFKPEFFFSGFLFATASVAYITAMIIHLFILFSAVQMYKFLYIHFQVFKQLCVLTIVLTILTILTFFNLRHFSGTHVRLFDFFRCRKRAFVPEISNSTPTSMCWWKVLSTQLRVTDKMNYYLSHQ